MNRFIQKTLCLLLLLVVSFSGTFAQNTKVNPENQPKVRCYTDEALRRQYETDPAYRAMIDQREREYQAWKASNRSTLNDFARTTLLTGPVVIPIVFHIVLPNPETITDTDVEYVVNRLNLDFSGLNPDSTNGVAFYSVRGHSLIRFCLARRDPSGNPTMGIERKVGTTAIAGGEPQPIKNAATVTGGFSPWDVTRYYNVWVGNGGGLLGIAPAIGVGTATNDGVCVAADGFANNPCSGTIPQFNLGRTAVHEIGHNFGLFHTFQGGCADGDNGQITSPSCQLPASILSLPDQSPAQSGSTSGCPTGTVNSGCASSPNPPGKQYQNYMDYTDDACYSMFNNTQVERMHWLLENCRAGYLTSNGCQLPASVAAFDGAVSGFVSPGGTIVNQIAPCVTSYPVPTCPGAVTPRIYVQNFGSTTMTSVTISLTSTGSGTSTGTYSVNIPYGKRQVVTLANVNAVTGANTLTATITQVNGSADAVAANNTFTTNFTIPPSAPLPRVANFLGVTETAPLTASPVPTVAGFTNATVAGTGTQTSWCSRTIGNGGNTGSIGFNGWNLGSGNIRDWRSTAATFAPIPTVTDSLVVEFDVAHRQYSGASERLQVLYSLDCGGTWIATTYNKLSPALATETPANTSQYLTPAVWRRERIALRDATIAAGGTIQFAIRGTSNFGNWIYVDNINIAIPVNRDAAVTSIVKPAAQECSPTFTPQVVVRNLGVQPLTSYRVEYQLGTGPVLTTGVQSALAVGASATVTLTSVTGTPGAQSFRAKVIDVTGASGTGDQSTSNDELVKPFVIRTIFNAPVAEGFETPAFPPVGWGLVNPNADNTWVRNTANGGFGQSASSMFINNYDFNTPGRIDELVSVPVNTTGADSVVVSFDLAHKNFTGFNDSLIVLTSSDCGVTWVRSTYAKGGAGLATAGASTASYTSTVPADWRKERVSIGGAQVSTGNILIALRNRNDYGNNVFIDNINISLIFRRDIQAQSIVRPNAVECSGNFTPSFQVRNNGLDAITGFTANYRINTATVVSQAITGVNIAPGASQTFNLTPVTGLPNGIHSMTMYATSLTTTGGSGDQNTGNDTIRKQFNILATQAAPLAQNFEGTFAPGGWGINNPDNSTTWGQANIGFNSGKSATIQNYTYNAIGSTNLTDELITPNITYSGVDSVFLSFDLSAITKQYPGATAVSLDTLEVLLSKDCGVTSTVIFKKWGNELQTISDPNYPNTLSFIPNNNDQWKNFKLNITSAAGLTSTGTVFFFRNKSNVDNNIYLDNINLSTVTIPLRLKQQGYLITPTPFNTSFTIQHLLPPTDLRYVEVFDARGRLVYRNQFGNNGASSSERVDISREAAGVYVVKLGYTNKVISERIVKAN